MAEPRDDPETYWKRVATNLSACNDALHARIVTLQGQIKSLGDARSEVDKQDKEIGRLREALGRIKLRGIHADTNPTMMGENRPVEWWYGYLTRADSIVRKIARDALEGQK